MPPICHDRHMGGIVASIIKYKAYGLLNLFTVFIKTWVEFIEVFAI